MGDAVNSSQSTRKSKTIFNGRQFNFFAREEENSRENGLRLLPKSALPNFGIPLSSEDGCSQVFLAVVWQSGILGAAIFSSESAAVDLLMDVQEKPPFEILRSLIMVVQPVCIITSQGADERFKDFLIKTCERVQTGKSGITDDSSTQNGDNGLSAPKLHFVPGKDFALGPAKQRIGRIRLPSMPENIQDCSQVNLFLASVVDFRRSSMIRSFGGLLTFMDRTSPLRAEHKEATVSIVTIRMFTMEEDVAVDQNSLKLVLGLHFLMQSNPQCPIFSALRVFHSNSHPSVFKAGKGGKEGFSLFALFNKCKSSVGTKMLRLWFSRPTRNIDVLRSRHQAIRFFMHPHNEPSKMELEKILSSLKDVASAMGRMAKGACTLSDWVALEKTSLCGFMMSKLIEREDLPLDIEIFGKIRDTFPKELARIAKIIHDVVDVEASQMEERFVVKPGVAEELDDMKRRLFNLNETLTYIATEELARMAGETREIRVTYIPNMGYLLVLEKEREIDGQSDYSLPGLEFVFKAKSGLFYKSERMRELDNDDANFGDLTPKIHDCERSIMIQLQNIILRYAGALFDVLYGAAELDCLISIASTANCRSYTVPEMDENFGILIQDGRHPLQELCVSTFVANRTELGSEKGRVSIVTGPNMCGKSVYLKQVGIIVFLAHVGCPVPASVAKIGLVDKIFTRLLSEETVALRQSAFLIDLTQVGMAVNYATEKSLIILDEFGKGTRSSDGLALLASILKYLTSGQSDSVEFKTVADQAAASMRQEGGSPMVTKSPFILLATHFHSLSQLIPASDTIHYLTLDHMKSETDNLVFLYKVKSGVSASSYAAETSRAVGFLDHTLDRIHQVTESLKLNKPIKPLAKLRLTGFSTIAKTLVENLMSYDSLNQDARVILDQTLAIVHRNIS